MDDDQNRERRREGERREGGEEEEGAEGGIIGIMEICLSSFQEAGTGGTNILGDKGEFKGRKEAKNQMDGGEDLIVHKSARRMREIMRMMSQKRISILLIRAINVSLSNSNE
jgi:hypothetical protein